MERYVHQEPGTEVRSISGYYTIQEEGRRENKGRQILYIVGAAVVDNSCCGSGGWRFLQVPGYIISWKTQKNDEGLFISEVEPILDEDERKEIQRILDKDYPQSQIIILS